MKKGTLLYTALLLVFAFASVAFTPKQTNNDRVIWTQVVQLDAMQAGTTSESAGLAIFRLTSCGMLSYKIVIQQLDEGDMLTTAHIHRGAVGVNGGLFLDLTAGLISHRKFQTVQLTSEQAEQLMSQSLYVNIHTQQYPAGSIRGQIQ
jgi:hypothetical protein